MRLKYFIILLTIIFPLLSQNNPSNEVDSLLKVSFQQVSELKFIESLKLSEKALQLSQEAKYQKGTIYAYLYIARVLQEVGLRKDAFAYIEKIEDDNYFLKDAFVQAEIYRLKGRIASSQRLYSLEKEHLSETVGSITAYYRYKEEKPLYYYGLFLYSTSLY